jgi:protein TonB
MGLLATFSVKAQSLPTEGPKNLPRVYNYVDGVPSPGYDIKQYLGDNTHYPDSAMVHKIEGRVIVKFIVNEDGNITDTRVEKGVSKELDEEAIRVVKNMPQWKPGIQNGKPVKVYYTLPIVFKLNN